MRCSPQVCIFGALQAPQVILLKEGTDTSQGKPQLISNINACTAVSDVVRTTLGPRGMDKLIYDDKVREVASLSRCQSGQRGRVRCLSSAQRTSGP
jgi:hypothetical protein